MSESFGAINQAGVMPIMVFNNSICATFASSFFGNNTYLQHSAHEKRLLCDFGWFYAQFIFDMNIITLIFSAFECVPSEKVAEVLVGRR